MSILVLNAGSSSLKFELLNQEGTNGDEKWKRLVRGAVKRLGSDAKVEIEREGEDQKTENASLPDAQSAVEYVLKNAFGDTHGVKAVGHRVVHGGELFQESVLINDNVLKDIEDTVELAPLHNPGNLKGIRAAQMALGPDVPQVAVFDTSFHQTLPEHAYMYAVPYQFYREHKVRRYGFHGTSYRYVSERYRQLVGLTVEQTNIIVLHLGNGCSVCAIAGGKSIDTSMGFTPLEGLVMGTRSGDLDPSVVDYLMRKEKKTSEEIEKVLNTESGLLGLSGLTNDMRDLMTAASEQNNERAKVAIDTFCYRARKYVGSYVAALGGKVDAVVFAGGIGENNAEIRGRILDGLSSMGIQADPKLNADASGKEAKISGDNSRVAVWVIPTDEELMIARDTARLANIA